MSVVGSSQGVQSSLGDRDRGAELYRERTTRGSSMFMYRAFCCNAHGIARHRLSVLLSHTPASSPYRAASPRRSCAGYIHT